MQLLGLPEEILGLILESAIRPSDLRLSLPPNAQSLLTCRTFHRKWELRCPCATPDGRERISMTVLSHAFACAATHSESPSGSTERVHKSPF